MDLPQRLYPIIEYNIFLGNFSYRSRYFQVATFGVRWLCYRFCEVGPKDKRSSQDRIFSELTNVS
jgi:hypothetical protein